MFLSGNVPRLVLVSFKNETWSFAVPFLQNVWNSTFENHENCFLGKRLEQESGINRDKQARLSTPKKNRLLANHQWRHTYQTLNVTQRLLLYLQTFLTYQFQKVNFPKDGKRLWSLQFLKKVIQKWRRITGQ